MQKENFVAFLQFAFETTMSFSQDKPSVIIDEGEYYSDVNGYQVPQNICHRFRTKITTNLLADRNKVEQDRNESEYVNIRRPTPIYRRSQSTISMKSDYKQISNDLRDNICHGHPVQRGSHSKMIHNARVFTPDQPSSSHRRKKDWLGRWTEANIIRDRLFKSISESQKKSSA